MVPITHWLKSGGGVEGGGGDRESCRANKDSAGLSAFAEQNRLLQTQSSDKSLVLKSTVSILLHSLTDR